MASEAFVVGGVDAVASVSFGVVEGGVGEAEDVAEVAGGAVCDADAGGDVEVWCGCGEVELFDAGAE